MGLLLVFGWLGSVILKETAVLVQKIAERFVELPKKADFSSDVSGCLFYVLQTSKRQFMIIPRRHSTPLKATFVGCLFSQINE